MNINQEDINSCNYKQDVINSSASDIGEQFEAEQQNAQPQVAQQRAGSRGLSAEEAQNDSGTSGGSERGSAAAAE